MPCPHCTDAEPCPADDTRPPPRTRAELEALLEGAVTVTARDMRSVRPTGISHRWRVGMGDDARYLTDEMLMALADLCWLRLAEATKGAAK